MKELSEINKIIEELNRRHSDSILLGLGQLTKQQMNFLEKKTKLAIRTFQKSEIVNKDNSYCVSLYAVYFAKYIYNDNRFWENLSLYLGFDEEIVKAVFILAMKKTYETKSWPFYRSSRNEYVETIRMHSIVGNDHSGDNIVYAFYLVYLKDFQKNVTEDKLNLFFPFLDEVFKPLSILEDSNHSAVYNGVAYVRGLMPKSFARAYNVNNEAVKTIIKQFFSYFDKLHNKKYSNPKIDSDILNKLQKSFERNNNFNNDYTRVFVQKNTTIEKAKPVVEYHRKSTAVTIPSHFINFRAEERKSAEVIFYDRDKVIKKHALKIEDGAIGWHTDTFSQYLKSRLTQFRYEIRKLSTSEITYDSGELYYKSTIEKTEEINKKSAELPDVYKCLPNNIKTSVSLNNLRCGNVYSIKQVDGLAIKHAYVINDCGQSLFFMRDNTEITINEKTFVASDTKRTVTIKNSQTFDGVKLVNKKAEHTIFTGKDMLFSARLCSPYDLSDLAITINATEIDGMKLRSEFLKEILLEDQGVLKYYFNLTDYYLDGKNSIEISLKFGWYTLTLFKNDFYYYSEMPIQQETVEFDNKPFYYLTISPELSVASINDKEIVVENKALSYKLKLARQFNDNTRILKSNEVVDGTLLTMTDVIISDAEKRELIQTCYDKHYLIVEECTHDFYESKGTSVIIEEIKNQEKNFTRRLTENLEKVDLYFIELLSTELHLVLNGNIPDSFITKRYISPLLQSVNLDFLDRLTAKNIIKFLNVVNPQFDNTDIEIEYKVIEAKSKRKKEISSFINQLSARRRNVAYYLSTIAANTTLSRVETMSALKKLSANHSNKERKDYLESIDWFREFLYDNPLDLSLIQLETFIDMFLFYAHELDIPTIARKLNKIEHTAHSLSDDFDQNERSYIRNRLNEIAKLFEIEIIVKQLG